MKVNLNILFCLHISTEKEIVLKPRRKITTEKIPIFHMKADKTEEVIGYSVYLRGKPKNFFFDVPMSKKQWEGKG
jgi:hypothetical protein